MKVFFENSKKVVVASIVFTVILTVAGAFFYFKDHAYREIDTVQLRVSDEANELSVGEQIRIYSIENQAGDAANVKELAEQNGWTYDEDLGTLSYYGGDSREAVVELEHTRRLKIAVLKQNSSGKLEIYVNGDYSKTVDLYSDEWERTSIIVNGPRNYPLMAGMLLLLLIISGIAGVFLAHLLFWHMHWRENKKKIVTAWVILWGFGEIIAVAAALRVYPQQTYDFEDGTYSEAELKSFDITEEGLYAVDGDPNITIPLDDKIYIKTVSIEVSDLESSSEWAQVFLLNDEMESVDYFTRQGSNLVEFPMDLSMGGKASGVRLDVVSRIGIYVSVSNVTINERMPIVMWATKITVMVCLLGLFFMVSVCIVRNGLAGRGMNGLKWYLRILNPVILIYAIELLEHDPLALDLRMWVVNYVIIFLFQTVLEQLFVLCEISLFICDAGGLFLALMNHYVMIFRGMPLVVYDLKSAGTAAEVAGNYVIEITPQVIISIMLCAIYLVFGIVTLFVARRHVDKQDKAQRTKRAVLKTIAGRGMIVIAGITGILVISGSDSFGISGATLNAANVYETDGFVLGFLSSAKTIDKPEGYSVAKVEEILGQYETEEDETEELPNIIMIMNESFADLGVNGDYATNHAVTGFVDSLSENVIKGNCHVSVFGGGTSNSEFEALTGNSMAFLPTGTNAYQF